MTTGRRFALLVLLFIVEDFVNPATPGVFSFEASNFFMDGAIRLTRASAPVRAGDVSPQTPVLHPVVFADTPEGTSLLSLTPLTLAQAILASHARQSDRASPAAPAPGSPEHH